MAEALGRTLKILKNSIVIAGIQTKSISFNSEPIDITTDDDNGYRTILAEGGETMVEISFDGIEKDSVLRDLWVAGGLSQLYTDITLEWDDGSTLACDFFIPSYEETGSYKDKITFSSSLQSSGAYVYVPAA